jgi:hypothetical protein
MLLTKNLIEPFRCVVEVPLGFEELGCEYCLIRSRFRTLPIIFRACLNFPEATQQKRTQDKERQGPSSGGEAMVDWEMLLVFVPCLAA